MNKFLLFLFLVSVALAVWGYYIGLNHVWILPVLVGVRAFSISNMLAIKDLHKRIGQR